MTGRALLPVRLLPLAVLGLAPIFGVAAGVDPKYAIVGALGLGFLTLVMSNLAAGVALMALIAFVDVLPIGGVAVSVAKLVGGILALSWLALLATRPDTENDFFEAHPWLPMVLLAFVSWVAISAVWAEVPGNAFQSVYRFGLNLMLFPIVFTAVRSRKHVVWVLAAFLFGAVVSAAYGILAPAPPAFTGSTHDYNRLSGVGLDPNELAALLVASIALAAGLAASKHSTILRIVAIGAAPLCLAGVVLSLSRGGLIALTVALLAAVAVGGRWRLPAVGLLLVAALAVVFYFGAIASPDDRARVTHAQGGTGRTSIWKVGWRMVEANPVRGVGGDNFRNASVHYLLEPGSIPRSDFIVEHPKVAHNMYLEILADLGIVGMMLFLVILAFAIRCAYLAARTFMRTGDARMELISRALLVALAALLAADFFLSEQYSKQLWLLLALGPALLAIAKAQLRRQEDGLPPVAV